VTDPDPPPVTRDVLIDLELHLEPPVSGETFSFQSLASAHEPSRITSFRPADAMPAGIRHTNAVTSANTIFFFIPTSRIPGTSKLARRQLRAGKERAVAR